MIPERVCQIIDQAIQIHGATGISHWTPLADLYADVRHLRVEDGRGRPLGRSFRIKLWPSLVLLRDGEEVARVVRPREARDLWPLDEALPGVGS